MQGGKLSNSKQCLFFSRSFLGFQFKTQRFYISHDRCLADAGTDLLSVCTHEQYSTLSQSPEKDAPKARKCSKMHSSPDGMEEVYCYDSCAIDRYCIFFVLVTTRLALSKYSKGKFHASYAEFFISIETFCKTCEKACFYACFYSFLVRFIHNTIRLRSPLINGALLSDCQFESFDQV